jgi:hypothetical protein
MCKLYWRNSSRNNKATTSVPICSAPCVLVPSVAAFYSAQPSRSTSGTSITPLAALHQTDHFLLG